MASVGVMWAFTPSLLLYEVCSAFVHLAVNEIRFEVGLFFFFNILKNIFLLPQILAPFFLVIFSNTTKHL